MEALREGGFLGRVAAPRGCFPPDERARFQTAAERTRLVDVPSRGLSARRALGGPGGSRVQAVFGRLLEECLAELPAETRVKLVIDPRDQATLGQGRPPMTSDRLRLRGGPFLGGLSRRRGGRLRSTARSRRASTRGLPDPGPVGKIFSSVRPWRWDDSQRPRQSAQVEARRPPFRR
jgi:hypothetical protein